MEMSETDYTGWKDGKCWWVAVKYTGKGSPIKNARTVSEMVREGYEIREMPAREAVAAQRAAIGVPADAP